MRLFRFAHAIAGLQTGRRMLSKRSMRVFGALLSVVSLSPLARASGSGLRLLRKPVRPSDSISDRYAGADDLKSGHVLCYHRFEDRPKDSLAIKRRFRSPNAGS